MQGTTNDKNAAVISGKIVEMPIFSHELYGENFYTFSVEIQRTSGSSDKIPVMISDRLAEIDSLKIGVAVYVEGQFRSHNAVVDNKSKLKLMLFAREFKEVDLSLSEGDEKYIAMDQNTVVLDGFICKPPIYRMTPFKREITDILLAVNRSYNKSDYIPCICWGRIARFCGKQEVGQNVKVTGRMQSREYQKTLPDGSTIAMVAYEVSVANLELIQVGKTTEEEI